MARIAALSPGLSPPAVRIPIACVTTRWYRGRGTDRPSPVHSAWYRLLVGGCQKTEIDGPGPAHREAVPADEPDHPGQVGGQANRSRIHHQDETVGVFGEQRAD